jgi:cytochrome b561
MPMRNTPSGYGLITKALLWIIFVMMEAQLLVGYVLTRIDDDYYESIPGLSEDRLFGVHMSLGATVLLLALFRLAWRVPTPLPAWAATLTSFERRYELLNRML